ncbi:Transcriptional regulatory protein PhoP [Shimia thalassica]|uniref:Transcriptional regulatory protein PhoP n=1 Tax=Shimia thalassica TaxID=1715693 RepID=A0A0P1I596_9RHOB|nr:response regulator [Shimia thalassica]CUJ91087.1 Transcriptional regulatory protein PhoP [Shimia thalassica]
MDDLPLISAYSHPTARRPMLGLTVLVVEDSRFACDALRLMCLRSGARIRRADCLASARRHLQVYRPSVAIVDMGLPDGSGADLIEEMSRSVPRIDVVLATSGDSFVEDQALAAGADGFLSKPLGSLAIFQEAILSRLPADQRPAGPRSLSKDKVTPDPVAYRDDLCHAAETLREDGTLDYVAKFLSGLALSAHDLALQRAADTVSRGRAEGKLLNADVSRLRQLVEARLAQEPAL